jgi:hypothetical protein
VTGATAVEAFGRRFRFEDSRILTPIRRRAIRDGIILGGLLVAVTAGWLSFNGPAIDAHAYWLNRPPVTYNALPGTDNAYLYSPAFAQVLSPLTSILPFHVFLALWLTALLLTFRWLTGPILLLPAVILFFGEISYGNIHLLLAAAMVVGFRYPWTWSLVLLTKVTPGIGLIWFAARREWRSLAIALGATAVIAAVSFALEPNSWFAWADLLQRSAAVPAPTVLLPGPLWLRVLIAAVVVVWGARTDRAWTVPVAAVIALPHGTIGIVMLVGVIPLLRGSRFAPPPLRPLQSTNPAAAVGPEPTA